MGIWNLMDGHQPENASTVFSRRYGDCKDKTFLALTLLRGLGIEAYAVVVHTADGDLLNTRLPSASIFDHVIVVAVFSGKKYWMDPTQSFQGGTLHNYAQPYEGYALIIDGKSNTLTKMTQADLRKPIIDIVEAFDLSKGPNHPSTLMITTTFKGGKADRQRKTLLTTSKTKLQSKYATYFQKIYPELKENNELKITDKRDKTEITIIESYEIPNIWIRDEAKKSHFVDFAFNEIANELDVTDISPSRKMPLGASFPQHISKKIHVHFPSSNTDSKSGFTEISDSAFKVTQSEVYKNDKFTFTMVYKSLKGSI